MITLAFHIGKRRMDYSVRWSLGHSSQKEKLNDKEDFWFPVWPIGGWKSPVLASQAES